MGPQRYTVVDVPSGTLVSIRYLLYLLYYTRITVRASKNQANVLLSLHGTFLVTYPLKRADAQTFDDL